MATGGGDDDDDSGGSKPSKAKSNDSGSGGDDDDDDDDSASGGTKPSKPSKPSKPTKPSKPSKPSTGDDDDDDDTGDDDDDDTNTNTNTNNGGGFGDDDDDDDDTNNPAPPPAANPGGVPSRPQNIPAPPNVLGLRVGGGVGAPAVLPSRHFTRRAGAGGPASVHRRRTTRLLLEWSRLDRNRLVADSSEEERGVTANSKKGAFGPPSLVLSEFGAQPAEHRTLRHHRYQWL